MSGSAGIGLFFLAAVTTFLIGRAIAVRCTARPWAAPLKLAAAIVICALVVGAILAIDTEWRLGRLNFLTPLLSLVNFLSGYEAANLAGGALAGVILCEAFRIVPPSRNGGGLDAAGSKPVSALAENATVLAGAILAAALFATVAILAQPSFREGLQQLQIGTIATINFAAAPVSQGTQTVQLRQGTPPLGTEGGIINALGALNSLVAQPPEKTTIARDERLQNIVDGQTIEPRLLGAMHGQRDFLAGFKPFLDCVNAYVALTNDRKLIGISAVPVALRLSAFERAVRTLGFETSPEKKKEIKAQAKTEFAKFRTDLGNVHVTMRNTLLASGDDGKKCAASITANEDLLLDAPGTAPYLTLFVAWVAIGLSAPEIGYRDLIDWLDDFDTRTGTGAIQNVPWLRVRVLAELAAMIAVSEAGVTESAFALGVLDKTAIALKDLPKLPRISSYATGLGAICPAAGKTPDADERGLLGFQLNLAARLLNAIMDNPDSDRVLGRSDLVLARELTEVDIACLPPPPPPSSSDRFPIDIRPGLNANYRVTYGRTLLTWAATGLERGAIVASQAKEFRESGEKMLRGGYVDLKDHAAAWRDRYGNPARLATQLFESYPLVDELTRARNLAARLKTDPRQNP